MHSMHIVYKARPHAWHAQSACTQPTHNTAAQPPHAGPIERQTVNTVSPAQHHRHRTPRRCNARSGTCTRLQAVCDERWWCLYSERGVWRVRSESVVAVRTQPTSFNTAERRHCLPRPVDVQHVRESPAVDACACCHTAHSSAGSVDGRGAAHHRPQAVPHITARTCRTPRVAHHRTPSTASNTAHVPAHVSAQTAASTARRNALPPCPTRPMSLYPHARHAPQPANTIR